MTQDILHIPFIIHTKYKPEEEYTKRSIKHNTHMSKRVFRVHMVPIRIIFTLINLRCAELMSMPHNFSHRQLLTSCALEQNLPNKTTTYTKRERHVKH